MTKKRNFEFYATAATEDKIFRLFRLIATLSHSTSQFPKFFTQFSFISK